MKNSLLLKITIMFLGLVCMADMVIIPAIGGIFAALSDADPVLLEFLSI